MTVIRPNSISGVTSITALASTIDIYTADGSIAGLNLQGANIVGAAVTCETLTVSGNVSIGGTLSYEDVINVDSIGIITARNGIQVVSGGINASGVVTATSFSGPLVGNVTGNVTGNLIGEVNSAAFDTNSNGVIVTGVATATGGLNVGAGGTIIKTDSEGRVAIGTSTFPSSGKSTLVVNGAIESLRDDLNLSTNSEGGQLILRAPITQPSGTKYRYLIDNYWGEGAYGRAVSGSNEVNGIRFVREDDADSANGLVIMSIAQDGIMHLPYQPAFDSVCNPGPGQTVYTTLNTEIVFNATNNNRGNHFSTSTGRFTAPITGTYFFSIGAMNNASTSSPVWIELRVNGSLISQMHNPYSNVQSGSEYRWVTSNYVLQLNGGDYVSVFTGTSGSAGGIYGGGNNHNHFVGYLIG
jgi:hypothetical protein